MMTLVFFALIVVLVVDALLVIWIGETVRRQRRDESDIAELEHIIAGYARRISWVEEELRILRDRLRETGKQTIEMDDGK